MIGQQLALFSAPKRAESPAFSSNRDEPIHRWVPWIAGFSADFVQRTFGEFLDGRRVNMVLDPFAGVGTTLVETIRKGHDAIGFEINPYAALATRAKIEATEIDPEILESAITSFRRHMSRKLSAATNGRSPKSVPPPTFKSRVPFFSPAVLRKVLYCLDYIEGVTDKRIQDIFKLAFGSVMVSFSNYSYEPSLTTRRGVGRPDIPDASVDDIVEAKLAKMLGDVRLIQNELRKLPRRPKADLYETNFMEAPHLLKSNTVDLIVTSPPYLNNYHYIRNTRPHIHWLGLNRDRLFEELETKNVGKFWQTVREGPVVELAFDMPEIARVIGLIRDKNTTRGIYGGNGWANYAASYYNDTYRFLEIFKKLLRRSGTAVVVVGNSIIQGIDVQVDRHIGIIAESLGLTLADIAMLRTKRVGSSIVDSSVRRAENTRASLYESAVILRKR